MNIGDGEAPGLVEFEHHSGFAKEGCLGLVDYWCNRAKLNFVRDCVKEW